MKSIAEGGDYIPADESDSEGFTPKELGMKNIPNTHNKQVTLYVEAVPGMENSPALDRIITAEVVFRKASGNEAVYPDSVLLSPIRLDVDVDSNNDGEITPDKQAEDNIEYLPDDNNYKGQYLQSFTSERDASHNYAEVMVRFLGPFPKPGGLVHFDYRQAIFWNELKETNSTSNNDSQGEFENFQGILNLWTTNNNELNYPDIESYRKSGSYVESYSLDSVGEKVDYDMAKIDKDCKDDTLTLYAETVKPDGYSGGIDNTLTVSVKVDFNGKILDMNDSVLFSDDPPVDLDVDTNGDNKITIDDDPYEFDKGGVVELPEDNLNKKLTEIQIKPLPEFFRKESASLIFSVNKGYDKIKIWTKSDGTEELPLTLEGSRYQAVLPLKTSDSYNPISYYVEGLKPSDSLRDIVMELKYSDGNEINVSDKIALTVCYLDLDIDVNGGGIDDSDDPLEESPGAVIVKDNIVPLKDRLVPLSVNVFTSSDVELKALRGGDRIKILKENGQELTLPKTWKQGEKIPKTLYIEGIRSSAEVGDVVLSLACVDGKKSYFEDIVKMTVLKVDLDVDVDGCGIGNSDDPLEESPGAILPINDDDDNDNDIKDLEEAVVNLNDDDLIPLRVDTVSPTKVELKVLSGEDKIRIWTSDGGLLDNTSTIWKSGASFPKTFYVEGIKPSDNPRDIVLSLECVDKAKNLIVKDLVKLTVLKVDLRTDLDRDGVIDFNTDIDKTTSDNPYRFWINNDKEGLDDEVSEFSDLEISAGTQIDSQDTKILCRRDLEDFSLLHLKFNESLRIMLRDQKLVCKLALTDTEGTPDINIFSVNHIAGYKDNIPFSKNYLKDINVANQVVGENSPPILGKTNGEWTIPYFYFIDLIFQPHNYTDRLVFLFEGKSEGRGNLTVRLYDNNNNLVFERKLLHLELYDIKDLYDHFTVGDSVSINVENIPLSYKRIESAKYEPEEKDYILFVHGWRMKPWERRAFANTAYKRLFWQGYKGKFGLFSWPTEWVDTKSRFDMVADPANYNNSEEKAYVSAMGLHELLLDLNHNYTGRIRMFAHSMGNVVASEALRVEAMYKWPPKGFDRSMQTIIYTYVASQAATVAQAYDSNVPNMDAGNANHRFTPNVYINYPEIEPPQPISTYFNDIADVVVNKNIINFFNGEDAALSLWVWDQRLKPQVCYKYDVELGVYAYEPLIGTKKILTLGENPYKIFAHISESYSKPLGAISNVGNVIKTEEQLDLNTGVYKYGNGRAGHSMQFYSDIMTQYYYWDVLLQRFDLK